MERIHRAVLSLTAATLILAAASVTEAAHLTARLDGDQAVPATGSAATGSASFTLTSEGLSFLITAEGLSGPITAAHFHLAERGVAGGVLRTLTDDFGGDFTAFGLWRPTDAEPLDAAALAALLNGRLYVNIHTAAHPGGEIRGQVDVGAGSQFSANLSGTQENPPLAVAGRGTGLFVLREDGRSLSYKITVTGLTGPITATHVHNGAIGVNGGVAFDLLPSFTGNTAVGTWSSLTDAQLDALMAGRLYVNVHTAAHPGGEIRGQITLSAGFGLGTHLDGAQEVPPVATSGEGSGVFTLTPEGLQYHITVSEMTGPITAAHLHNAPFGLNGSVVRDITASFGGTQTASGVWRPGDAQPLDLEMLCELLSGNLYVNVHSAAHPAGEIRGQVRLSTGETTLLANATGAQEEPAVPTNATGTGLFRLTPAGLEYSITVAGLSGAITAAHIHAGPIGVNGGIEWNLTPDFGGGLTAVGIWTPASAPPLTTALIKELLAGRLYVNVHTAMHPAGEIRGQILLSSGTGLGGPMTPEQERAGVASDATGTIASTLTNNGMVFTATVDDLGSAFTAAHFHNAPTGVNGGAVRDLTGNFASGHGEGVWHPADPQPLTSALVDQLLASNIYLNVHTAGYGGGEVRGQLLPSEGFGLQTMLHAGNEVPPTGVRGSGTAYLGLREQALVFGITADRLTGPVTAAHFHRAPPGANGPVVFDIGGTFVGTTSRGNWRTAGATPLTPELICDLLSGDLYINIHTAAHPGGEIRGNLRSLDAASVDESSQFVPRSLLFQNFPNPFADATSVSYRLAEGADVTLKIYDAQGREVATLVDDHQEAGLHQVRFEHDGLPGGIYLYRLQADGRTESRKLTIRK